MGCTVYIFQARSFWDLMEVPQKKFRTRFSYFFGANEKFIDDRQKALDVLNNVLFTIQNEMLERIKTESTYGFLLKLYYIFDEVHSVYLAEKEARTHLVKENIDSPEIVDPFVVNRNIERDIIDSCNIWIENCILYQHDLDIKTLDVNKEFVFDDSLIIDLYLYGFASRGISLLNLSTKIGKNNSFYGLEIKVNQDIPAEILKYHPVIYFNTSIVGNQNVLSSTPLTKDANTTDFGIGFENEYNVGFLQFLATIKSFHEDQLRGDEKSLTVIEKEYFIELVERYTIPPLCGESFYNSFVLTKDKIKKHLRNGENIIWKMGTNKYRHELRPFVALDDGNILIAYGSLEQSKQLWASYFSNGGMCYTNPAKLDYLTNAMELKNKELSDVLVNKIREILNNHYSASVDLKDVKYQRIFGEHSIDYGDYDVVFYSKESKELFLIESKYFSDSLNPSGIVTDYKKMFEENGYYDHCRKRCDLALSESEKLKYFLGEQDQIAIHLLFISSKPIEMEFTDEDGIVTMLPLCIFEKYLEGKLINDEDDQVMRPIKYI